jgi:hypothetical protein
MKYIWKYKRPQMARAILSKKSNAGGIKISNFKLNCRGITIKTAWYQQKKTKNKKKPKTNGSEYKIQT